MTAVETRGTGWEYKWETGWQSLDSEQREGAEGTLKRALAPWKADA